MRMAESMKLENLPEELLSLVFGFLPEGDTLTRVCDFRLTREEIH